MKPSQIARGVRQLLDDPEHWTQGAYAENNLGFSRLPYSEEACSFCLEGAFDKVSGVGVFYAGFNMPDRLPDPEMRPVLEAASAVIIEIHQRFARRVEPASPWSLVAFNDHSMTSIEDVHLVLDNAIARLEAREKHVVSAA